ATAVPTAVAWLFPALTAIDVAAPAMAVAVNVTGLPFTPVDVAVRVLVPAALPSVQLPTLAIPLAFVVWAAPVMPPCPDAIAKVTAAPPTGLPNWSFTITAGGVATAVFTVAVCWSPAETAMLPALPAVRVAVNVSGLRVRPADVAFSVWGPAVVSGVR